MGVEMTIQDIFNSNDKLIQDFFKSADEFIEKEKGND